MKSFLIVSSFALLFFIIDGCSEDEVTNPPLDKYPIVARNWEGLVTLTGFGNGALEASFTQTQDSILNGAIVQYLGTLVVSDSVVGIIKNTNQITLATIDYTVLEGTVTTWYLTTWNATLNARGDSISGTWHDTGGYTGTFMLVKK